MADELDRVIAADERDALIPVGPIPGTMISSSATRLRPRYRFREVQG